MCYNEYSEEKEFTKLLILTNERVRTMSVTIMNKIVRMFDDRQCDFSFRFDWQDDGVFVLHTGACSEVR